MNILSRKRIISVSGWILYAIIIFIAPIFLGDYLRHTMIMFLFYISFVVSYSILVGHAGMFSLGQQMFIGFGAYATAFLTTQYTNITNILITIPMAAIFGGFLAYLMSFILLKLPPRPFSMVTLAFNFFIRQFWNLDPLKFTGGALGIKPIYPPTIEIPGLLYIEIGRLGMYYQAAIMSILMLIFYHLLTTSRFGVAIRAIKENEILAENMGINIIWYKRRTWIICGALAAIAGNFYGYYLGVITPYVFLWYRNTYLLTMAYLGGITMIEGCILGPFIYVVLAEFMRVTEEFRIVIFSAILLITILFFPEGIGGKVKDIYKKIRSKGDL